MKITTITFGLLLFLSNLHGQNQNPLETKLKVWQETEKPYKRFIKKQAKIRKQLDKHIEPQDLEKIQILRTAYLKEVEKSEKKGALIPEMNQGQNTEKLVEFWKRMNNRFRHQIRSHEIITPMLMGDKELYNIAEYITEKYKKQIEPVNKKINKSYAKLKKKELKIHQKYTKKKSSKKQISNSKKEVEKIPKEALVFISTKILIIESAK